MSNVILEGVLEKQLKEINEFEYKGNKYKFSDGNIHSAIHALKNVPDEGLLRTSERAYDLFTLGKSFEETIQGDKKSFTIRYIDWENLQNNVYHVTDEFVVDGIKETRRPDLVLFVNGIPFGVIENKRRDKNLSLEESISQHIRNQGKEFGIPRLYQYSQLLLAVQPNEVKYGVIDANPKFWSYWKEEGDVEQPVSKILQSTANGTTPEKRLPTEQDRILYCLCRPERLMEITYKFSLYDATIKKAARYQQYFTVKNTLTRIKELNPQGQRKGGVIWHTQGSGKSLTMVMLAKCISLEKDIANPRVVIVTDRIDLDKQIYNTFHHCGKTPKRAKSGNHLIDLINDNGVEIITTVIDKFESAISRRDFANDSQNIFVLVDESHRSQYGTTHAQMKRVLPKACYIGFTGTPLLHKDKSTANKFGGFILPTYSIKKAVDDKAVVPLLYEGRSAKLTVNQSQIDKGFDRLAEPLTEYQTKDLKRKFSSITEIYKSQQVIEEIVYDISKHYCENWKESGFKAMLAVPLRETALQYQKLFEGQTNPKLKINTAVIISAPDSREDHEEVDEEPSDEVQKFMLRITKNSTVEQYEETTIEKFKSDSEDVELLIVVSKLLTGFDAPRCSILYIAKHLQDHGLLQAIARVNRLFEGKDFGHIIDYVGILGKLDKALTDYQELEGFDTEDLEGTITNITDEIKKLPQRYSELWDVFKEVPNKKDIEALERHLAPKDIRDLFREKLIAYARNLQLALSSDEFYIIFREDRIKHFVSELKFFKSLRDSVSIRYADKISYKEYEKRVRKLLNTHINADGVEIITEPINIFDEELFKKEVERITGSVASKADAIAYKMKSVISMRMDEDPVFFKKFSQLIDETIKGFLEKRLTEAQYLASMMNIRNNFVHGTMEGTPTVLSGKQEARAFYGIIKSALFKNGSDNNSPVNEKLAHAGIEIDSILQKLLIRDWKKNEDVQKQMKNEVEDYLLAKRGDFGVEISFEQIDGILEDVLRVAKTVYK
ncbi:MAG: DEAD/DEAH box helicase [Bacteroidota bacterium]|nr:MAG: DEAD/DEAH box helicase [Bacteroidota bacterium]